MKFKKILMIGFNESNLDKKYWGQLDQLCEEKVLIAENNPEVSNHLADTDAILVKFSEKVDKNIIDTAPNLKFIGTLATAYKGVDANYAKSKNIAVCNIPGYSTEAVAEFAFAVILEQLRELERGKKQARDGDFSEATFSSSEIKDKIFGIIGLGNIGSRIAEIALGFGADVRYWSRNRKKHYEKKGIKYQELDTLIKESDFISLNLSLNKETENILNEQRIQNIKSGAVVVNLAPMELVDMNALEKRLQKEDIYFIYDHSDELSKEQNIKFIKCKNCIIYPPIAYVTKEARIRKQEILIKNLKGFLEDNIQNKVI